MTFDASMLLDAPASVSVSKTTEIAQPMSRRARRRRDDANRGWKIPDVQSTVRTIFLSDLHLGAPHSRAALCLDLLRAHRPEFLYLVGDVVDGWALKKRWRWDETSSAIVRTIFELREAGTRVVYTPGNHDEFLRRFRLSWLNLEFHEEATHWTVDGRRLLVTHGDHHDGREEMNPLVRGIGDLGYDLLFSLDRPINALRDWFGKDYWSLLGWVKAQSRAARHFVERFESRIQADARANGYDGVVCGHVHTPTLRTSSAFTYANCGDWAEHATAIVETQDGKLHLIDADRVHPAKLDAAMNRTTPFVEV